MSTEIKKLIALLLGLALCLAGCSAEAEKEIPMLREPVAMEVDRTATNEVAVIRTDIYDMRALLGSILSYYDPVAFEASGTVKSVEIKRGQKVKKGDVLARLDDRVLQEKKAELKERLNVAISLASEKNRSLEIGIELLRLEIQGLSEESDPYVKSLMEMDIKEIEYQLAKQKKEQQKEQSELRSQISELDTQIASTILRAPMDGIVGWISGNEVMGSYVAEGQTFININHMDRLYIRSPRIPDSQITRSDQLYALIGDQRYELTVLEEETVEEQYKHMFENGDFSYFSVELPTDINVVTEWGNAMVCCRYNYQENVLALSKSAIMYEGGNPYVYRMENGEKVRVDIEVGGQTTLYQEILSGVEEGDVIYVPN